MSYKHQLPTPMPIEKIRERLFSDGRVDHSLTIQKRSSPLGIVEYMVVDKELTGRPNGERIRGTFYHEHQADELFEFIASEETDQYK